MVNTFRQNQCLDFRQIQCLDQCLLNWPLLKMYDIYKTWKKNKAMKFDRKAIIWRIGKPDFFFNFSWHTSLNSDIYQMGILGNSMTI